MIVSKTREYRKLTSIRSAVANHDLFGNNLIDRRSLSGLVKLNWIAFGSVTSCLFRRNGRWELFARLLCQRQLWASRAEAE